MLRYFFKQVIFIFTKIFCGKGTINISGPFLYIGTRNSLITKNRLSNIMKSHFTERTKLYILCNIIVIYYICLGVI